MDLALSDGTIFTYQGEIMSFHIECAKCQKKSPPVETTVPPPVGWTSVVTGDAAKKQETTWRCAEHA